MDGRKAAAEVKRDLALRVEWLRSQGIQPGLAVVLVGSDPASVLYVQNKTKSCRDLGIRTFDFHLPADTSEQEVQSVLQKCNQDPAIHGILLQLPLPAQLSSERLLACISPDKDVDGLTPENMGRLWRGTPSFVPCTPLGIMHLIRNTGVSLRGKHAVVVGRSNLVGRPMAALLLNADATVTIAHTSTQNLPALVGEADVLVVAVGKPHFLDGNWIKPGSIVVDVGINRLPDGKIVGDVAFSRAQERAAFITPVPGGVGPMTVAMLLQNTVLSAEKSCAKKTFSAS